MKIAITDPELIKSYIPENDSVIFLGKEYNSPSKKTKSLEKDEKINMMN